MPRIANQDNELDQRGRSVLFAAIAEYVSTGKTVSSRALTNRQDLGFSPATIRRELHKLTERGFLAQPHTSAGRIPTDRAFRIFAKTLKTSEDDLDSQTHERLMKGLDGVLPGEPRSWQEVVKLLSDLSSQAALVVTPALSEAVLRQLRFVPCGPGSLLAVIVTREGLVHNAYVETSASINDRELERIHNYLGELIEGRTLNEVRQVLRKELDDARERCDALREKATMLGAKAIQSSVGDASEIVVEGRSHLVSKPDLKDRVKELMRFLEEKTTILQLLDRAAETERGPIIIIGQEGGENFSGCAMITSPFGVKGSEGQVGIIGPVRMDYSAVLPLVAMAAKFVSSRLLGNDD